MLLLTHAYFLAEDASERSIMRPYVPLGILSISAWLQQHGIDAPVFDTTFSDRRSLLQEIRRRAPRILGIYTNLMTRSNVLAIIAEIRGDHTLDTVRIVLGGPEVTHHADRLIEHGADVIVIGEGEETMRELAEIWGGESDEALAGILGIVFRGGDGTIVHTPPRDLIRDIDVLPFPARDRVDMEPYIQTWRHHHGAATISISTMRGCPFTCRWCSRAVYGESYRRRAAARVVDEMALIREQYNPETLWFVDDVFTINPKWMEEFAGEVERRGLKIPYECITRADRMNERIADLLAESGCFRVWIGAESGSQRILDAMDRRVTIEQVQSAIEMSRNRGIATGTFIMLGYPGETEEDILLTIEHLKQSLPDQFTVTVAYPITGTPFHQEVRETIEAPAAWETTSDRDSRYARPYSDRYYRFALRRMINEVEIHRLQQQSRGLSGRGAALWIKARTAAVGMRLSR